MLGHLIPDRSIEPKPSMSIMNKKAINYWVFIKAEEDVIPKRNQAPARRPQPAPVEEEKKQSIEEEKKHEPRISDQMLQEELLKLVEEEFAEINKI